MDSEIKMTMEQARKHADRAWDKKALKRRVLREKF